MDARGHPRDHTETRRLKVLFLTYHFPPSGGAGVQRSAKFVRYLAELGVEPIVVAGPMEPNRRWSPPDATLTDDLPPGVPVYRCKALSAGTHFSRIHRLLLMDPASRAWQADCVRAAERVLEDHRIDVVYASMAPYETAIAAARIASRAGVPWVADLRDPWALDEMRIYPSSLHRVMDLGLMRRRLRMAAAIVMNCPEACRALLEAFPEFEDGRVHVIPNGFDSADFADPPAPISAHRFRIVHTGHLHVALGLAHRRRGRLRKLAGGERAPTDILTRSHVYLLAAIEEWMRRWPEEASSLEVILAGDLTEADRSAVKFSSARKLIEMRGYVSHRDAVALIRSASALFLPMHNLPPGIRARIVPAKTYEYLAAGRPILAALPESDARDLVAALPDSAVCPPDDPGAMLAALRQLFARWRAGAVEVARDPALLARFERRALAGQLAAVLHRAYAAESRTGPVAT